MNDAYVEDHLFSGSPCIALKKKERETIALISLVGILYHLYSGSERPTVTKKQLWKDQEKHLPALLTSPSGVFVI